jgi:hypothetical protein
MILTHPAELKKSQGQKSEFYNFICVTFWNQRNGPVVPEGRTGLLPLGEGKGHREQRLFYISILDMTMGVNTKSQHDCTHL